MQRLFVLLKICTGSKKHCALKALLSIEINLLMFDLDQADWDDLSSGAHAISGGFDDDNDVDSVSEDENGI